MDERTSAETLEIEMLLEAVFRRYGYDFRSYSRASLRRRVRKTMEETGAATVSALMHEVLHDPNRFERLLLNFSINVTEMFRDPEFFLTLRRDVLPVLRDAPFLKVWHAGCATGEEAYSMAILLKETGLYEKTQLYATDFNAIVLRKAREGIFPLERLREYTANYQRAGGTESFGDYYAAAYDSVVMKNDLRRNLLFSDHNLVTDGVFGEMDLVVCRNVLIYFSRELQNRVLRLFAESLREGGVLCIGMKESLQFSDCAAQFEPIDARRKIFRKRRRDAENQPPVGSLRHAP